MLKANRVRRSPESRYAGAGDQTTSLSVTAHKKINHFAMDTLAHRVQGLRGVVARKRMASRAGRKHAFSRVMLGNFQTLSVLNFIPCLY